MKEPAGAVLSRGPKPMRKEPVLPRYGYCYLNPKGMRNTSLLGYFLRFWAIVLPTVGVQVKECTCDHAMVACCSM